MAMTAKEINATFPETMSSLMLMKALGVSGRKMRWLLAQGYIPHTRDARKTHCYTIAREDVVAYLKDSKMHPNKYPIPEGCFSTRNAKPGTKQKGIEYAHDPVVLQRYLRQKWNKKPQILSLSEAAALLGYTIGTLHDWSKEGFLDILRVANKSMIAKEELIHCVALRKMQIRPGHSDKHQKLMEGFAKWEAENA